MCDDEPRAPGRKPLYVYVDEEQYEKIRLMAYKFSLSQSAVVRTIIDSYEVE